MCGVSALIKSANYALPASKLVAMNDAVYHRGPDGGGQAYWLGTTGNWEAKSHPGEEWQVGLAHRRLSILDLSDLAYQPMTYLHQYHLVFNGEVYNYLELRHELENKGYTFTSTGDSEVVVAAYAEWGTDCFARFRGMWAIIIFDSVRGELVVSRDRMGIKPLYYFHTPEAIAIASEIKQFAQLPFWDATLDGEACANYLTSGFERTDCTFFAHVKPIAPGTYRKLPVATRFWGPEEAYWHPENISSTLKNPAEAVRQFAEVFDESMRLHLRSDVPVGAQLSGGMDSSSIAMLMDKHRAPGQAIHTFTTQFPNYEHDETEYVEAVLGAMQAHPHYDTPTPEQFLKEFKDFIHHQDEPTGSLTHFANFSLSRVIHQEGIKVVLNGQGGDELMGGYWQTYMAFLARSAKDGRPDRVVKHALGALLPGGNTHLLPQALHMFRRYRSRTSGSDKSVPWRVSLAEPGQLGQVGNYLQLDEQARRLYDLRDLLLPRLLKWDDRNLMAFSVEGRYPLLDHVLMETCLSFDSNTLYRNGWSKWPLRESMKTLLPKKVLARKAKVGYVTPQEEWLFKHLRPHLEDWLKADRPIWGLVERDKVQAMAQEFWASPANARAKGAIQNEAGQLLFRLFAFDTWMEVREVVLP